jgi:hypothetical protein
VAPSKQPLGHGWAWPHTTAKVSVHLKKYCDFLGWSKKLKMDNGLPQRVCDQIHILYLLRAYKPLTDFFSDANWEDSINTNNPLGSGELPFSMTTLSVDLASRYPPLTYTCKVGKLYGPSETSYLPQRLT